MWQRIEEADGRSYLQHTFTFKNFSEAFAFMTRVALLSEKMDRDVSRLFFVLYRHPHLLAPYDVHCCSACQSVRIRANCSQS